MLNSRGWKMITMMSGFRKYYFLVLLELIVCSCSAQQVCTVPGYSAYTTRQDLDEAAKDRIIEAISTYVSDAKKYIEARAVPITVADKRCVEQAPVALDALDRLAQGNTALIKKCYLGYKAGQCATNEIEQVDHLLQGYEKRVHAFYGSCCDSSAKTSAGVASALYIVKNSFCDYVKAAAENSLPNKQLTGIGTTGQSTGKASGENPSGNFGQEGTPSASQKAIFGPAISFVAGAILIGVGAGIYYAKDKLSGETPKYTVGDKKTDK